MENTRPLLARLKRLRLSRVVILFMGLSVPLSYNACGKFTAQQPMSFSSQSQEPLQFDRTAVPEAVKSGFTLRGGCVDGLPISIKVDAVEQSPAASCASGVFSYDVILPGADGPKVITATAIAIDGRERRDSVTVIKDTLEPALAILNVVPKDDYLIISGTCESGLSISPGGDITSMSASTCTNSVFQTSAYLSVTPGDKIIEVAQSDKAGNRGHASQNWRADKTAPILIISSPTANAYIGASVAVAGTCEAGLSVSLSGTALAQPLQATCPMGSFSSNVNVAGDDGTKTIIVSQTDASNNKGEVTVNVTKDTVAPALTVTAPAMSAMVQVSSVAVRGTCESGIPVIVSGTGVAAQTQVACSSAAFSGNVVLSAGSGQKLIDFQQTDVAGNSTKISRTISNNPPTSTLSITQPAANSLTKGAIALSGVCDNGGVLAFSGDIAATASVICANSAYSKSITLSSGDGLKTVTVKQTLNSIDSMASRSFTKDSTAPVITIAAPLANAIVNGNFSVSGSCETGLSVAIAGAGLTAAVNATCANGSYSAAVASTAGDGAKAFSVSQTDATGNVTTVNRSVTRDAIQPTLNIASPANGATVGSSVAITGACETGLAVALSGTGLAQALNANCSAGMYSQNVTLSAGEGAKAITAKQTDGAGNVATINISVNKDSVAPVITITEPAAGTKAEAGLTIKGACESGLSLKASGTGVASEVTASCSAQAYSLNITFSAGDGVKAITISQTDAAGNVGSVSRQFEKAAIYNPDAAFAAAKTVLTQYCTSCHKPGAQAGYADFTITTEAEFISKGFVVAGDPDQSKIIYRLVHYNGPTTLGSRNMPIGGSTSFPVSAYDTLVSWVKNMKPPVTNPPIQVGFTCSDPSLRATALSYTLTKSQYVNSLNDLFGSAIVNNASVELSILPTDSFDANTNKRGNELSTIAIEAYFSVAKTIATAVGNDSTKVTSIFGSCALATAPTATCIDTYLNGFAKKIFRRPLTSEEITFAKTIANRGGDYIVNLKTLLALHLQSPAFIWRVELGKTTQSSTAQTDLTPYEVATRISYMTTDTTPDDTLLTAAASNQLATVAQVQTQVRRLLDTPRGREKTKKNLMRWSMNDKALDFSTLPADLRGTVNVAGLGTAMVDETSQYIDYMVYSQKSSFKNLLTSKVSLASNASLAQIYGHTAVSSGATALMTGRRQGLLMRSPFFSTPRTRTAIIRRGVDFQKRILCNEIPPPSGDIVDQRDADELTDAEKLLYTNRDAIAHQTRAPLCMSCHATINPTGFAFENMDPFGRIRTEEKIYDVNNTFVRNLPVNTVADVPLPTGAVLPVQDAYDLVTYVATSSEGTACFARNAFRYINERRETPEDDCQLSKVHTTVSDPSKSIVDSLVDLIANDNLFVKKN